MTTFDDILGPDSPDVGIFDVNEHRWVTNRYWMVRTQYVEDLPKAAERAAKYLADVGDTEALIPCTIYGRPVYTYVGDTLAREFEGDLHASDELMSAVENMAPKGTWERQTGKTWSAPLVYRVNAETVALLMGMRP